MLYGGGTPRITIITPCYNRRKELPRAIASVKNQKYRDFEYIIVDDGSKEAERVDDIVQQLMDEADFPVAFIKKANGGVHTARNAGIKISRGEMIFCLDSDDELVADGLRWFIEAWDDIPQDKKREYREVVAFCQDEKGRRIGEPYPQGVNALPYEEVKRVHKRCKKGEQCAILRGDIMRANPWQEPEGVTFVSESLLWLYLDTKFKSWFINECPRIYHTETGVSYSNLGKGRSNQQLINFVYNSQNYANHCSEFGQGMKFRVKEIVFYTVFKNILKGRKAFPKHLAWAKEGLKGFENNMIYTLLYVPNLLATRYYRRKNGC